MEKIYKYIIHNGKNCINFQILKVPHGDPDTVLQEERLKRRREGLMLYWLQ